jgi:hypothetical protein
VTIANSIIRLDAGPGQRIGIMGNAEDALDLSLANNLIYDIGDGSSPDQVGVLADFNTFVHAFNNTILGGSVGMQQSGTGTLQASNNLVIGQTDASFAGTMAPPPRFPSVSNLSDDSSAPGDRPVVNTEPVFVALGDYHLDCSGGLPNAACSAGLDVGSNGWIPFVDDFDGERRPRSVAGDAQVDETPWDIGADQQLFPKSVITSPTNGTTYHGGMPVTLDGTRSEVPKGFETWFGVLVDDGSDPMTVPFVADGLLDTFNASVLEPGYVVRLIVATTEVMSTLNRDGVALPCQPATPTCQATQVARVPSARVHSPVGGFGEADRGGVRLG